MNGRPRIEKPTGIEGLQPTTAIAPAAHPTVVRISFALSGGVLALLVYRGLSAGPYAWVLMAAGSLLGLAVSRLLELALAPREDGDEPQWARVRKKGTFEPGIFEVRVPRTDGVDGYSLYRIYDYGIFGTKWERWDFQDGAQTDHDHGSGSVPQNGPGGANAPAFVARLAIVQAC